MNFDIRTLSVVISMAALLQTVTILMHYLVNKTYKGIGWWLIGYISIALSTALIPVREIAGLEKPAIILTNIFQLSGSLSLYVGINRFFNKRENRLLVILFSLFYLSSITYFTFADYNLKGRIIVNSVSMAFISFLIACMVFRFKTRSLTVSANFISAVFLIQGCLYITRAGTFFSAPPVDSFFTPSLIQVSLFIVTLININLWMSGFIVMINQRLNEDNSEARGHFELIFNTSPDAAIISRLDDGIIVDANDGFIELTGLSRGEIIGGSTADMSIWVSPSDRDRIRDELIKKGIAENIEVEFRNRNGNMLSGLVSAKIITLHGKPHVISVARDITLRKKIEDKLIRAIDEAISQRENAEKAKHEKELLLKEVHHRIKNNMNTIVGLLSIQSDSLTEPSAIAALQDTSSRIRSMMMLYDKLYRSEGFLQISIREYLTPLVDEITGIFPNRKIVRIEKDISDFMTNAETLFSLGIIINELITNMMKYAFRGRDEGVIGISAALDGRHASIVLWDNGTGIPEHIDISSSTGFGLQLVGMLIRQIGGTISIDRTGGSKFTIEFDI